MPTLNSSSSTTEPVNAPQPKATSKRMWNWHPAIPMTNSPIATWPIKPFAMMWLIVRGWLPVSDKLLIAGISILTWFYLSPALERCREFEIDWIAQIYFRNLVILTIVAGGLHLYLYTFRRQDDNYRYDSREFQKNRKRYTLNNQVYENIFWSLGSGVTWWTAYEVVAMWAYANGLMPHLAWGDNPVWFVLMFVFISLFGNFHFYWIHRLIHWQPLFNAFHYLHHRNINVGPWSGMSMHPVEHALYLSSALIHIVMASHPIHIIFHLQMKILQGPTSHSGFEKLTTGPQSIPGFKMGDFFHQLHHRYFECNYGETTVPLDHWFGSYHDGTPEARERIRERMQRAGVSRS